MDKISFVGFTTKYILTAHDDVLFTRAKASTAYKRIRIAANSFQISGSEQFRYSAL
jgi:hypothetical protein